MTLTYALVGTASFTLSILAGYLGRAAIQTLDQRRDTRREPR